MIRYTGAWVKGAFLLTIGFVVPLGSTMAALSAEDAGAIRKVITSYTRAWLEGDKDKILGHFHPDAVLMPHHGVERIEGIKAIEEFWWPADASPSAVTQFEIIPKEIEGFHDLAYFSGRFRLTYWYGQIAERKTFHNEGNYLSVLRKRSDGSWYFFRSIWNDPVPEEE